jgi:hypothetical protein
LFEPICTKKKKIREEALRLEREKIEKTLKVAKTIWTKAGIKEGMEKEKKKEKIDIAEGVK